MQLGGAEEEDRADRFPPFFALGWPAPEPAPVWNLSSPKLPPPIARNTLTTRAVGGSVEKKTAHLSLSACSRAGWRGRMTPSWMPPRLVLAFRTSKRPLLDFVVVQKVWVLVS